MSLLEAECRELIRMISHDSRRNHLDQSRMTHQSPSCLKTSTEAAIWTLPIKEFYEQTTILEFIARYNRLYTVQEVLSKPSVAESAA
jgi:hypothetical protein